MKVKDACSVEETLWQPRQHLIKQRHDFANKGPSSQGYGFSSSHVWMWQLDYKESWAAKNWCFWTVVLEKTLESPLDCKESKPVHPKGNQSWIFIGRTDVAAETLIFWSPDMKSWLIGKDPDAGEDWRQEEKEKTEDEMVGWHHWLDRHGLSMLWELVMDREPVVMQSMGLQRVRHNWAIELNWTELIYPLQKIIESIIMRISLNIRSSLTFIHKHEIKIQPRVSGIQ